MLYICGPATAICTDWAHAPKSLPPAWVMLWGVHPCIDPYCGCVQELLKAMSLTGSLALPTWALFYFIGTCLWAFYRAFPSPSVAGLLPDAVFPNFILHELPPGGLLLSTARFVSLQSLPFRSLPFLALPFHSFPFIFSLLFFFFPLFRLHILCMRPAVLLLASLCCFPSA